MRRVAAGAEVQAIVNGRSSWSAGAEIADRNFRNLGGHTLPAERAFFTGATSVAGWLGAKRNLVRVPGPRFLLDSSAVPNARREFANWIGPFPTHRGCAPAPLFPRAHAH